MEELINKVQNWAMEKGLIPGDKYKQTLKLIEESGELAGAILRQDYEKTIDSIGDCIVVLIILSEQLNLNFEGCLSYAWNEIQNRTGKMVDGTFIKDI